MLYQGEGLITFCFIDRRVGDVASFSTPSSRLPYSSLWIHPHRIATPDVVSMNGFSYTLGRPSF